MTSHTLKQTIFAISICLPVTSMAQNIKWSKQCSPNQKEAYIAAFSADGKKIFSGSEHLPTSVRIFDADNGDVQWDDTLSGGLMCGQDVEFTGNDLKIVVLEENGNVLIYDNTSPKPTLAKSIKAPSNYAFAVAISPDNNKFAVGCSDKKLALYNIADGSSIRTVDAHLNFVYGVDWSADDKVATCGDDLTVKIWDTSGTLIRTLNGHTAAVTCVKFSPDGSKLVSASKDKSLKIWDVASGTLIKTLTGHTKFIKRLDISDDGTMIVSCSEDETIKTWNLSTGTLDKSFGTPGCGIIYSVDFKPASTRFIVATTGAGDVQLWDLLFATSIPAISTTHIKAHPNPCNGWLNIHAEKGGINNVTLLDMTGRIALAIKAAGGETQAVDIQSLAPGIYQLNIETTTGNYTEKIIKE